MANLNHSINYIEFPLTDVTATKQFYGTVFGWSFQDFGPDYIGFSGAGLNGGFNRENNAVADGQGVLVVLFAADLEATERKVRDGGGQIIRNIYAFPGGRRFHFKDPNGNELAVWAEA